MAKDKFSPGMVIADGLAELVESLIEDLGPTGLALTGIQPIVDGLRAVGANNKAMVGGLDVLCRTALRSSDMNPALREFLKEFSDAYFDKIRNLSEEANEGQVQRAKGEGIKKASAKLREFLAKQKAKPSFASMLAKLNFGERSRLHVWVHDLEPQQLKEWNEFKERIGSLDELRNALEFADADRLSYLRMAYGREQTMLEALKGFVVDGTETPQIEKLRDKVSDTAAKADAKAAEWKAKADALRNRNRR